MNRLFGLLVFLSLLTFGVFAYMSHGEKNSLAEELDRCRREATRLTAEISDRTDEISRLKASAAALKAQNDATDRTVTQLRAQLAAHRQTRPDLPPPEDVADAVADFNELYDAAPTLSADGYAISAPIFTQFVFDAKQGVRLVPWLQEENTQLTLLVNAQERSLGEKDGIIAALDSEIAAHDSRFALSEERYALARDLNSALEKRLKAQRRQKIAWAAGALVVGYVVGR